MANTYVVLHNKKGQTQISARLAFCTDDFARICENRLVHVVQRFLETVSV